MLYHAHEPNFRYSCNLEKDRQDCCKICKSATAYKLHVYREHRHLISVSNASPIQGEICCPTCGTTTVDSLLCLSAHYRMHCEMGQKVLCVVDVVMMSFLSIPLTQVIRVGHTGVVKY